MLGVAVGSIAVAAETIVGGVPLDGEGRKTGFVGFGESGIPNTDGKGENRHANNLGKGPTLQVSKYQQDWGQSAY